jgi:hypothetical protein
LRNEHFTIILFHYLINIEKVLIASGIVFLAECGHRLTFPQRDWSIHIVSSNFQFH